MGVVAAMLDGRQAVNALRRTLPRTQHTSIHCRHPRQLIRALEGRQLEAVVIGPRAARAVDLPALRRRFPRIPLVVFGALKGDDAPLLLRFDDQLGVAALLLEGVDDGLAGEIVIRHGQTARRFLTWRDAPRALRLTTPLQQAAWTELLRSAGRAVATSTLATRLQVSREHLSRQFGAGGAPNLKRVIDFLRVVATRELAGNPGHDAASVATALGFSTPSHLRSVVRRVVGATVPDLPRIGVGELLRRFGRAGGRSRQ